MQTTNKDQKKIVQAIKKGWSFLESKQESNGKFVGYSIFTDNTVQNSEQKIFSSKTPFTTALILNSIKILRDFEYIDKSNFKKVTKLATEYIFSEKLHEKFLSPQINFCAWNYWEKLETRQKTLPADLDDTSLCFGVVKLYCPEKITGKVLAGLAHSLIFAERKAGGPYNTWLTDYKKDKRWDDCDVAVNANIGYVLSLLGIRLSNLNIYFENTALVSKYYHSPIVILYFISRAYTGGKATKFITEILKYTKNYNKNRCATKNIIWNSPMETALAITALNNFGEDIAKYQNAISHILENQKNDHWNTESFYFEYRDVDQKFFHGSEALTTSICIEALCLYLKKINSCKKEIEKKPAQVSPTGDTDLAEKIRNEFVSRAQNVAEEFSALADFWVKKVYSNKWTKECVFLPNIFRYSLKTNTPNKKIFELSLASLFGWVGYSIIDNILDEESPTSLLPFANFCLREMNNIYSKFIKSAQVHLLVTSLLNETDKAYNDEQKFRLKKFGAFFEIKNLPKTKNIPLESKSIGIVISALLALSSKQTEQQYKIIEFYRYFLKAKQTSDDAEDFFIDLELGRLTRTGALVLKEYKKQFPNIKKINIKNDKKVLIEIFWKNIYPGIERKMLDDLNKADKIINKTKFIDKSYFTSIISNLRTSILQAQNDRTKISDFFKEF